MEEILNILNQLEDLFPDSSDKNLKINLMKSLTLATNDIAKLIKEQDFEGVEKRIKQLQEEEFDIRSNLVFGKFHSGGYHSKGIKKNKQ